MEDKEIENNFTYHIPKQEQVTKYNKLREMGKNYAYIIQALCPDSHEKSIAITKLEECIMWANASIARNS